MTVFQLLVTVVLCVTTAVAQVSVDWTQCPVKRNTAASVLVAVDPEWSRTGKLHATAVKGVADLAAAGAADIRFLNFNIFPALSCAKLEEDGKWDFTLMDEAMEDFMTAAGDASVIIDIETSPLWMWRGNSTNNETCANATTVTGSPGPDMRCPLYGDVSVPRDPSWQEISTYFKRVAQWYTEGGFTDDDGTFHNSGHKYKFAYWEILNEVNHGREHDFSPQAYTDMYDTQVKAMGGQAPGGGKFLGPSLGGVNKGDIQTWVRPFLNRSNHNPPSTPVPGFSFHIYAGCANNTGPGMEAAFPNTDAKVKLIEELKQTADELRPEGLELHMTESGMFCNQPPGCAVNDYSCWYSTYPQAYWTASAGQWLYQFLTYVKAVDLASMAQSQILGYPYQFDSLSGEWPCGTMVDWDGNALNAKYWVQLLLLQHVSRPFTYCDTTATGVDADDVYVQGLSSDKGDVLVVVNKRSTGRSVTVSGATGKTVFVLDESCGDTGAKEVVLTSDVIDMAGFATVFVKND